MVDHRSFLSRLGRRILSIFKSALTQEETEAYYHVALSKWGESHNVVELSDELQKDFTYIKTTVPERKSITVMTELDGYVPELELKADTLYTLIAPRRAVLFQKERNPFTRRDVKLRKTILELYPFRINMPLFAKEHEFTVEDSEEPPVVKIKRGKKRKKGGRGDQGQD